MRGIDYNKEIPIPSEAYTNNSDKSVFYRKLDENGTIRKETIGKLIDDKENMMNPCHSFVLKNPDYVKQYYPAHNIPAYEYHYGLYALVLGIIQKTGLYSILQDVYQVVPANALLDYCMFSIQYRTCTTELFEESMREQALFSSKRHDDDWYSDFFKNTINEDLNQEMRIQWIRKLKENGLKSVWLAVDGSNNDCEVQKCDLAEYGHPKSHNINKTIIGYMYAVDAESGRPVTYFVYEGSAPDNRAFYRMSTFLHNSEIDVEGVILDRNFATDDIIQTIISFNWKYVIMLPSDTFGQQQMINEYGQTIKWKTQYRIPGSGLFGISDSKQLFINRDTISDISIFFNGINGSYQSVKLMKQIDTEIDRLRAAISKGKIPVVQDKFKKYLSLEITDKERKIVENYDAMDNAIGTNGFFSMATSKGMDPQTAHHIYELRDSSEVQYSILKSQEGFQTTRVHSKPGIYSKFTAAFLSSVIRAEIQIACKELQLDTNLTIQNLNRIVMLRLYDEEYEDVKNVSGSQKKLFEKFELSPEDIQSISVDVNKRLKPGNWSQIRSLPEKTEDIIKNSRKRGPKNTSVPKQSAPPPDNGNQPNKGGRPTGAKDKKPRKPRSDKGKPRKKITLSN